MRTAGIIGGLGPETTAQFYQEIIFNSFQKNKLQRPPLLIWSIPLEYQIEEDLITKATGEERYIPYLQDAARRLESGGADFIVIPYSQDQDKIGTLINNLVVNRYDDKDRTELLEIIDRLSSKGIKDIVLACTDLQLLTPKHDHVNIYDSMAILAEATVREILK